MSAWLLLSTAVLVAGPETVPPPQAPANKAPAGARRSVLVMPLEALGRTPPDDSKVVTQFLVQEAQRVSGMDVVAYSELQAAMQQDQARMVVGCADASCAAEIASSLNTDEIIIGSLSTTETSMSLTVSRIRARDAVVAGRALERVTPVSQDRMLDAIPGVVATVFGVPGPVATAVPSQAAPPASAEPKANDASKAAAPSNVVESPASGTTRGAMALRLGAGALAALGAGAGLVAVAAAAGVAGIALVDVALGYRGPGTSHGVPLAWGVASNLLFAGGGVALLLVVPLLAGALAAGVAGMVAP